MGILLTAAHILFAMQAAQATVAGTVRDEETGEPLAGAVVVMPDLNRITATDEGGRYVLLDVPPGPQHIMVRLVGHAQRALHALVPGRGQLDINVSLRSEPIRLGTIEVRTPLSLPGLEDMDTSGLHDRSTSMAAVRNNPLLSEPDPLLGLEELIAAVEKQESADARQAAINVARASLDLQRRYRTAAETDLDLLDLWACQLVIDSEAGDRDGMIGDAATLRWVRDRIARDVSPAELRSIDARIADLRAAAESGEHARVAAAAASFRSALARAQNIRSR